MDFHALVELPQGNIGAFRSGMIGETPYEDTGNN
jgi:hypothetical protein